MLYWQSIGFLYLLILTYQDIRHKRIVDDRYNFFMMGVTVSLLQFFRANFFYLLALFITVPLLVWFIRKNNLMGSADNKTILWSFIGFGLLNVWYILYYAVFLMAILILEAGFFVIIRGWIKAKQRYFPAYPSFLLAFLLVNIIYVRINI